MPQRSHILSPEGAKCTRAEGNALGSDGRATRHIPTQNKWKCTRAQGNALGLGEMKLESADTNIGIGRPHIPLMSARWDTPILFDVQSLFKPFNPNNRVRSRARVERCISEKPSVQFQHTQPGRCVALSTDHVKRAIEFFA